MSDIVHAVLLVLHVLGAMIVVGAAFVSLVILTKKRMVLFFAGGLIGGFRVNRRMKEATAKKAAEVTIPGINRLAWEFFSPTRSSPPSAFC